MQAIREEIAHGEAARVAQRLSHQKEDGDESDEAADGIEEAVKSLQRNQADHAEERRGAHEIARDGEAVLPGRDFPARGEIGAGAARALRGPVGDSERREDKGEKDRDGDGHLLLSFLIGDARENVFGEQIEFCGSSQIEPGDDPADEELRERKRVGKRERADYRRGHELRRETDEEGKQEVVDEEKYERRDDEEALDGEEMLEFFAGGDAIPIGRDLPVTVTAEWLGGIDAHWIS